MYDINKTTTIIVDPFKENQTIEIGYQRDNNAVELEFEGLIGTDNWVCLVWDKKYMYIPIPTYKLPIEESYTLASSIYKMQIVKLSDNGFKAHSPFSTLKLKVSAPNKYLEEKVPGPFEPAYNIVLATTEAIEKKLAAGEFDGLGILRIEKTRTEGKVDFYAITFTDGTAFEYQVKNGEDYNDSAQFKALAQQVKTDAGTASQAAQTATKAETAAKETLGAATLAKAEIEKLEASAKSAASQAKTSETNAQGASNRAAAAASGAVSAAETAAGSASTASQAAQDASGSASQAAGANSAAQQAKQAAMQSETNAAAHETKSGTNASEAKKNAQGAEKSAEKAKLEAERISKNLDDIDSLKSTVGTLKYTWKDNSLLGQDGKVHPTSESYSVTSKIKVMNNSIVFVKTKINGLCAFGLFDKNDKMIHMEKPIKSDTYESYILEVPEDGTYIVVNCFMEAKDGVDIHFSELQSKMYEMDANIRTNRTILDTTYLPIGNAIDDSIELESGYVENGIIKPSETIWHTPLLRVKPNTKFYVDKLYCKDLYSFYDSQKRVVPNVKITATSTFTGFFETPYNVNYVQLSSLKKSIKGAYVSEFEEYRGEGYAFDLMFPNKNKQIDEITREKSGKLFGKNILVLGDSISDNSYHTPGEPSWKKWSTYLSEKYQFNLTNDAIAATGFISYPQDRGEQTALIKRIHNHTSSEKYDMIIIFMGINDFIQAVPLGDDISIDYQKYLVPAMKHCLDYLIETYPTSKICALLPLQYYGSFVQKQGKIQSDYINAMQGVYDIYSIPSYNLYANGGFRGWNETFKNIFSLKAKGEGGKWIYDGLHPNQLWDNNYLAPMIYNFLENII